ncbi:hypothetical protein ACWEQL_09375 [Kitasatospora sp. NPDC004240]
MFRPTHVAPQDGLPTWTVPDLSEPSARLDPLLPVQLIGRQGDWGHVMCANGWSAWVDGRLLVALPEEPRAPTQPLSRTADPRPALAEVERALGRYRTLLEDLVAGGTDLESFQERTRGLRIGLAVDGESLWVYDPVHDRWCYCDGLQLQTYAATARPTASRSGPGTDGRPHTPNRAVPHSNEPTQAGEP